MKAILFDLDGVIIDSGQLHYEAWKLFCARYNKKMTYEEFKKGFGRTNNDILKDIMGKELTREEVNNLSEEKEGIFRSLAKGRIKTIDGAIDFIKKIKAGKYKIALVSSTPRENINFILREISLLDYFDVIISSEDVMNGKPNPECYLRAAERLGVSAKDCIVIEDAIAGVEAALLAGMKCIAITTTQPREKLVAATYIIDSYSEIKESWLK
jgi:beta-phosphoglucomutase family hydrolase